MTLKAILWDMDGTLIDSEPAHEQAFDETLKSLGVSVPPGTNDALLGASFVEVHQKVIELTGLNLSLEDWRKAKWVHYQACSAGIKPLKNSQAILDNFTHKNVPMALVSNSSRNEVDLNLAVTNLSTYFAVTISRDDVEHGKPAPDSYLAAASALSLSAEECLVVEDSVTGARAGLAAGMTTVFHPESEKLVEHCPKGATLLPPSGSLGALLEDFFR